MVVNESFARRFFPGREPVGREVRSGIEGPDIHVFQIVGVVNDAIYQSARKGFEPTVYVPLMQLDSPSSSAVLTVRSAGGRPEALTRSLAEAIARVDRTAAFTIQFPGAAPARGRGAS